MLSNLVQKQTFDSAATAAAVWSSALAVSCVDSPLFSPPPCSLSQDFKLDVISLMSSFSSPHEHEPQVHKVSKEHYGELCNLLQLKSYSCVTGISMDLRSVSFYNPGNWLEL